MREILVVNTEMVIPLHSLSGLDSVYLGFLLELWPMY